jgi:hypothetical protein
MRDTARPSPASRPMSLFLAVQARNDKGFLNKRAVHF